MNDDKDYEVNESPLSGAVTKEGKTVDVEIYEGDPGKWLLEVVDEYGNSTLWKDQFDSDQEALRAALDAIDEEGIDSFIDSPLTPKLH